MKKRNPQDSTMRNVRAANKKLDLLIKLTKEMNKKLDGIWALSKRK